MNDQSIKYKKEMSLIIRRLRYDNGMNQTEFASWLDCRQTKLSKVESGQLKISVEMLMKLRSHFSVDINKVFDLIETRVG